MNQFVSGALLNATFFENNEYVNGAKGDNIDMSGPYLPNIIKIVGFHLPDGYTYGGELFDEKNFSQDDLRFLLGYARGVYYSGSVIRFGSRYYPLPAPGSEYYDDGGALYTTYNYYDYEKNVITTDVSVRLSLSIKEVTTS